MIRRTMTAAESHGFVTPPYSKARLNRATTSSALSVNLSD